MYLSKEKKVEIFGQYGKAQKAETLVQQKARLHLFTYRIKHLTDT